MPKIHFLGTASGTEPIEGLHHTSFCIETGDYYYWFDAGENCSRNAHISGIDLLRVKAVFISHTHIDHVGGLGNLLWSIRKLTTRCERRPPNKEVKLFIPDKAYSNSFMQMLECSENGAIYDFDIHEDSVTDGLIFEDENIKVTAFHNHHLQDDEGEAWLSYSYLIETDNKIIVFSGDIRDMYDLDTALKNGCDLLLLETGHHKLLDISDYIRTQSIGEIIFVHHGREIINNRNSAELMLKDFTCHASISYDGMIKEL